MHLGVGLGASLLQVMDRMWFPKNEVPNNAAHCPMAFESKGPTSGSTCYRNIEREVLGILHGLDNFTTTASPKSLA